LPKGSGDFGSYRNPDDWVTIETPTNEFMLWPLVERVLKNASSVSDSSHAS